jgi:PTS system nitrogen regulatory IIA component
VLEKWATQHKLPFHVTIDGDGGKEVSQQDNIHVAMRRGGVFYDLEGVDKEAVLQGAVQRLTDTELDLSVADQEVLLNRLIEREAMASTGVGKGVAIPHPRTPLKTAVPSPTICTFFLKSPLPFQAVDDRPVFVLFILLSPSINTHLHCMSRLAFCVRDDAFVSLLQSRPAPQALYERVAAFEQQLDTL